jgi:hypothetical protein
LRGTGASCTSSVLNLCGHKDEVFARPLAERLCVLTNLPVSVSVGIHVEHASASDIEDLQSAFSDLGALIAARVTNPNENNQHLTS